MDLTDTSFQRPHDAWAVVLMNRFVAVSAPLLYQGFSMADGMMSPGR